MRLLAAGMSANEVGSAVGVSRQTIQKWKKRYSEEGDAGLIDRSHAPKEHPRGVSSEVERLVVKYRRKYKDGPRKLRMYLLEDHPDKPIPAASTIGRILTRHGLTEPSPPRRRRQPSGIAPRLTLPSEPNDVWCIDFKGEFEVNRTLCYPLTVTDDFSRFALLVRGQTSVSGLLVEEHLWRAFRQYGLPSVIRSDNGPPFASYNAPRRLSRLATIWVRLGIEVERIDPGKPSQNGRHERFHKTLKHATARPPAKTFDAQQKRFDRFRRHYNERRPHEALGMRTPADIYVASHRSCPPRLPPIEHPTAQRVLKVSKDGRVEFRSTKFRISKALAGQTVGLTETNDDLWVVTYGPITVAHLSFQGKIPEAIAIR